MLHTAKNAETILPTDKAIALKTADNALLKRCGSGGAFTMLAERVLQERGVVVGAAYRPDWSVEHIFAKTPEELKRISGTKYLRSELHDAFKKVLEHLKAGEKVIFSGTGCQVAGLHAFLRKDYEQLLTVNIACFGAPSPTVWLNHLAQLTRRYDLGKIQYVNFREKKENNDMNFVVRGTTGTYSAYVYGDPLGWALCKGVVNRPCCSSCRFKNAASRSDISIGDAHFANELSPELQPRQGLSLAVCHTQKGFRAVESLKEYCSVYHPLPLPDATAKNKGFTPFTYPNASRRRHFFRCFRFWRNARLLLTIAQMPRLTFLKWWLQDCKVVCKRKLKRWLKRA